MKVHIVGVNHDIQYVFAGDTNSTGHFQQYLETEIKKHSISLIAEEFSEEAVRLKKGAVGSVAHAAALATCIDHRYVDPNRETRKALGIPNEGQIRERLGLDRILSHEQSKCLDEEKAKYSPKREEYWLSQIEKAGLVNVLFVCGASHLDSFSELLTGKGHQFVILSKHWKLNQTSDGAGSQDGL